MASIQQVIAEIQIAADLPPSHKAKAVQIIRDAMERLKLKAPRAPRKVTNAKNLVTIEHWEADDGWSKAAHGMGEWVDRNKLCPKMVNDMIDEFRREMMAKGKQYANFALAFQVYMRKGYLSKPMLACTLERSTYKQNTVVHRKGIEL